VANNLPYVGKTVPIFIHFNPDGCIFVIKSISNEPGTKSISSGDIDI